MARTFEHAAIEPKWQARWEADGLYRAEVDPDKPKYYALVMFPYTSGDLHLGHWWNFALADMHVRYKRMQGFATLFPPGFDAFGLPAEGAAIKSGAHPYPWTMENIRRMEIQWRTMGGAYDWTKELATCQPGVLPLEPVVLSAVLQARPRLSAQGARQLVPEPRRAGQ